MGCLVVVVSCSRVVGSAYVFLFFLLVVSLVFVWPVPGMWAVVSSL